MQSRCKFLTTVHRFATLCGQLLSQAWLSSVRLVPMGRAMRSNGPTSSPDRRVERGLQYDPATGRLSLGSSTSIVPAGASNPYQLVSSKSARPASTMLGTSGICDERFPDVTASAVMEKGEGLGETDVNVKVKDRFPWHATLSYNTIPADGCQSGMRFDLAAIVLVLAWVFSVHATPVDVALAWNGHDQVDTAAIQPAVDADDSMQLQAMAIAELLRTATLNDFDELIGKDDTVYLSHDISNIHLSSLDQGRATASIAHEVTLPSSGSNYDYYYYLAFVPLGVVGFTILQGWRTWQKERRVDRQAVRRGRPFEVATS